MARFRLSPGGLSGGESMSDLYQMQLVAQQQEKTRETNIAKSTVSSLISSYNTAKSQPLQQQIVNTMKDYYHALPAVLKGAVDPYIAHGPTSPMAEKRRQWSQAHPPPKQVFYEVEEGVSNEYEWADYQFKASDYKRARDKFMTGEPIGQRAKLFSIPISGRVAVRNKEGMISVSDGANIAVDQMAERIGLDKSLVRQAIHLNNGRLDSGRKVTVTTEGVTRTYGLDHDLLAEPGEKAYFERLTDEKRAALPPETKHPASLGKFIGDLAIENTEVSGVDLVLDMIKGADVKKTKEGRRMVASEEISRYFRTRWPDYTVQVEQFDEGSAWMRSLQYTPLTLFGYLFEGIGEPSYTFSVIKGMEELLKIDEGDPFLVYVDTQGIYRDEKNKILGYNPAEAAHRLRETEGSP